MLTLLAVVLVLPLLGIGLQETGGNGLASLLAYSGAVAGSLAIGWTKKQTGWADRRWAKVVKPFQPAVVLGFAVALPWVAKQLGVVDVPDPMLFAQAPTATLVSVMAREALRRIKGDE